MIQINLFTASSHNYRFNFTKFCVEQLALIKEENADKISFHIYIDPSKKDAWMGELAKEKYQKFDKEIHCMSSDSYMDRVRIAHESNSEFSIKWDDDVFINASVWDYLIENTNILNKNICMLTPVLSNGVPSVDFFIKDFLTSEERENAHQIFLSDAITGQENIWGCNFTEVQKYIKNSKEWNYDEYWNFVRNLNPILGRNLASYMEFAKGIHPARFSYKYNKLILDKIVQNKHWITEAREYYTMTYPTVYCCNNLFMSKTSFWKDSQKLYQDGWDEGQLNVYSKLTNQEIGYVRNTCGIHMAYGCTERQKELEKNFIQSILQ
jgi:hypothetical protein